VARKRDYHKEWLNTKKKLEFRRQIIITKLGGTCLNPDNNPNCTPTENLELHHLEGKDWDPRAMSPQMRMKQYEQDFKLGRLGVLCKSCNSKDGANNKDFYSEVRHSLEEAPF